MTSLWDPPLTCYKQQPLTLCGWTVACLTELLSRRQNIHNWPNKRGEGVREQLAVESADGHRPWLLRECEMPKPDCSPEPGGQRRSRLLPPTERPSKTMWQEGFIQQHLLASARQRGLLCIVIDKTQTTTHKRCIKLGNKNNNNCFVKVFNTSFTLRSVFADRNQVLLLTSASPAVTLPLFIITAAEEEEVWGAQPPCLPPPDRTRHAAVMRSDTSAWMSCCWCDQLTPWLVHHSFTHCYTHTHTHTTAQDTGCGMRIS